MARLQKIAPYLLVLALLPLLVLGKVIFGGEAIGPFDQIASLAPFSKGTPTTAWDVLQADGVIQFHVWRDLVFDSWRSGSIPFWNPYELGGTPLLANSQSGALYPPHIIAAFLPVPTHIAVALLAWFHFAVAGAGVYALSRALGASKMGALVGAALFQTCAFMSGWTPLASVISTVTWIPWALANLFHLRHATGKAFAKALIGLGLSTSMMVLAGHLQFVAYGFMAILICMVGLLFSAARAKAKFAALPAASAVLCGAMLALPQLLPVLEYGKFSHRQNKPSAEGYQAYVASAIAPWELAGLTAGPALGDPRQPIVEEGKPTAFTSFWPAYVKRGENAAECAVGLSVVGIGLLFFLRRKRLRAEQVVLGVVGVFGLLIAIGTPLNAGLYYGVPGWSATGSPGRIIVLFVLAVSVLAGIAASDSSSLKLEGEGFTRFKPLLPLAGVAVLSLLSLSILSSVASGATSWLPNLKPDILSAIIEKGSAPGKATSMILLLVALGALLAWKFDAKRGQIWLIAGIGLGSLLAPGLRSAPFEDLKYKAEVGEHERVAVVTGDWGLIDRGRSLLPPNLATLGRIREIAGYDSLLHRDTVELLRGINGQDPAPPANGNIMHVKKTADDAKLAEAGVTKKAVLNAEGKVEWTPISGPGRVSVSKGTATFIDDKPGRIAVQLTDPGTVTLRERNIPGWRASQNGKELSIPEGTWITVEGEPGKIEFNYEPPAFRKGLIGTVLGLLLLAGLVAVTRKSSKGDLNPASNVQEN